MKVIALDLGAKSTGYASWNSVGCRIHYGTWKMPQSENERLYEIYVKIYNLVCEDDVDAVVYEYVPFQQGKANQYWHAMRGVLIATCEEYAITPTPVPQGTWKKHLVGRANWGKPKRKADLQNYEAIKALRHAGYGEFETTDEADALGVLLWYLETEGKQNG